MPKLFERRVFLPACLCQSLYPRPSLISTQANTDSIGNGTEPSFVLRRPLSIAELVIIPLSLPHHAIKSLASRRGGVRKFSVPRIVGGGRAQINPARGAVQK